MITIEEIRNRLAEAIRQSPYSQSEIARLLKIKHQTVNQYAQGLVMPALDTFANICTLLDIDANEILCLTDRTMSE